MEDEMIQVHADELKTLVIQHLTATGMPEANARTVSDVLVFADLRGTHSHGVLRVEHYIQRIRKGGINLKPDLSLNKIKPAIGLIDAEGGMGHVAASTATEKAIEIASEQGIALVGVKNSSHCGALAYYVNMALEKKMASIVSANTDSAVVPFGGKNRFLGTNPFAFGFPAESGSILLDMATSEVAFGKIYYAREKGSKIPEGWAVTEDGEVTTDANAAFSLFPFGGYKGYGINMMVEALTGLLIGSVFGPHIRPMYGELETCRNLSSFHLIIDPAIFAGPEIFRTAQAMIDELHSQLPAPGYDKVMVPGEIEANTMKRSMVEGVAIPTSIYNFLKGTK
ncbi:Ldh family oxidoreductase [Marispirochaeta sp.]|jgi:ureidoglycolate dehydrogenase (NAD+)|uniref:Ldh family oxidoreductase n=1 Tax=Marispirochaeta sp. TaxID=2038653 RepID=UPI0029C90989|nr:Ldh family oxidoreductase [Marispirochaeta sp.]